MKQNIQIQLIQHFILIASIKIFQPQMQMKSQVSESLLTPGQREEARGTQLESTDQSEVKSQSAKGTKANSIIDFDKMMMEYRKRTEFCMPYTFSQTEETMFIDEKKLVTIEYIFYQNDTKYSTISEEDCLQQTNTDEKTSSENPRCLAVAKDNYLDQARKGDGEQFKYLDSEKQEAKVEALISMWKIGSDGQLWKDKEVRFSYDGKFKRAEDHGLEDLRLRLSSDKKYVILPIIEHLKDGKQTLQLLAWKSSNLKPLKLSQKLKTTLKEYLPRHPDIGKLQVVQIVGKSNYLLLKFIQPKKQVNFTILDIYTGREVCRIEDELLFNLSKLTPMQFIDLRVEDKERITQQSAVYYIPNTDILQPSPDLLVQRSEVFTGSQHAEQAMEWYENQDLMSVKAKILTSSNQVIEQNGAGSLINYCKQKACEEKLLVNDDQDEAHDEETEIKALPNELNLVFFFAGSVDLSQKWHLAYVKCTLQELLQTSLNQLEQANYLKKEGLYALYQKKDLEQALQLPGSWFVNENDQLVKWQGSMEIRANSSFSQIGVLNKQEEQYFAFNYQSGQEIFKFNFGSTQFVSHGRNQETKDNLMLYVQSEMFGSKTHVFFDQDKVKVITCPIIHPRAFQDTQVQNLKPNAGGNQMDREKRFSNCLLQSVAFTRTDQQLFLKTETKSGDYAIRSFPSQRQCISFPVMIYNIGMQKIIVQLLLSSRQNLVYEIPERERFINFIEFNTLEDIGFKFCENLRIEACSRFAILTQNKKTKKMYVNLMLIDPYYDDTQVAIFKSSMYFQGKNQPIYQDTVIKSIMYKAGTDKELKLLQQYDSFLQQYPSLEEKEEGKDEEMGEIDVGDVQIYKGSEFNFERVPMILTNSGKIYYVVSFDGLCTVKEIEPSNDQDHKIVFEIKSESCLGFKEFGKYFYFIEEEKVVNKLQIQDDSGTLLEINQYYIKEKERQYFQTVPYSDIIITDIYIIINSKIFYLYDNYPPDEGVLDMEELSELQHSEHFDDNLDEECKFISGPYQCPQSDQFIIIYQQGDQQVFQERVYKLPDSTDVLLVTDYKNKVSLATFIDENTILIKFDQRYMVFDENGTFIDECDFEHHSKQSNEFYKDKAELTNFNRMVLHKMSDNNKYFLFEDLLLEEFCVFTLRDQAQEDNDSDQQVLSQKSYSDPSIDLPDASKGRGKAGGEDAEPQDYDWVFECCYKVGSKDWSLTESNAETRGFHKKAVELIQRDVLDIKMDGQGRITMTYWKQDNFEAAKIHVIIRVFENHGGQTSHLKAEVNFKENAKVEIEGYLKMEYKKLVQTQGIEEKTQLRLPETFRDMSQVDKVLSQIDRIQSRIIRVVKAETFDKLVLVQCGHYIKFSQIEENQETRELTLSKKFKETKINFKESVEIISLKSTEREGIVQIIAKDIIDHLVIILTWDFNNNFEAQIRQIQSDTGQFLETYIVQGLNKRYNYFIGQYHIFDLENNIPMQYTKKNSLTVSYNDKLSSTKTMIYKDSSRYLSIEQLNLLKFPITRMDIQLWKDIKELGASTGVIKSNTKLVQFNKVFHNDTSLFHHFADNQDIIDLIHQTYKQAANNGSLAPSNQSMPLMILNPDKTGMTAMDWALENQKPNIFTLMLDMLEPFDYLCLSKLMINRLPFMIKFESEHIYDYFNTSIYKSILFEEALLVEWPPDEEQFIFASPTSLITAEAVEEALQKEGLISKTAPEGGKLQDNYEHEILEDKQLERLQDKFMGQRNRPIKRYHLNFDPDEEYETLKKISLEALDFDWIFDGENAKNLIGLLSNYASSKKLFVQKPIQIFIELMWQNYQPQILHKILVPYLVFMSLCLYITSFGTEALVTSIKQPKQSGAEAAKFYENQTTLIAVLSVFCSLLWMGFVYIELTQVLNMKWNYFTDYWNCIDFTTLTLTGGYIVSINFCQFHNQMVLMEEDLRTFGSIVAFFQWIKVFYWMRLFKTPAYYINLICTTIADLEVFNFLVFIIICAFGNFFYIMNQNTPASNYYMAQHPDSEYFTYIKQYTNNAELDALISIYFQFLGDFQYDGYNSGQNTSLVWVFFLLSTCITCNIFMNMLLAIMADTFSNVQSEQEESALYEQVQLIQDFLWLLDIKEKFKGMRYIIYAKPEENFSQSDPDLPDCIEEVNVKIVKRMDEIEANILNKVQGMQKTNRQILDLLRIQSQKIHRLNHHVGKR